MPALNSTIKFCECKAAAIKKFIRSKTLRRCGMKENENIYLCTYGQHCLEVVTKQVPIAYFEKDGKQVKTDSFQFRFPSATPTVVSAAKTPSKGCGRD